MTKYFKKFFIGGFIMVKSIVEFFRNLPAKKCTDCGNKIEEQADCYGNTCDHCLGMHDL